MRNRGLDTLLGCLDTSLTMAAIAGIVVGIVCYFLGYGTVTVVCAVILLAHSAFQVLFSNQKGFTTETIAIVIGLVVAMLFDLAVLPCIAVSLCIEGAVTLLGSWLLFFFAFFSKGE